MEEEIKPKLVTTPTQAKALLNEGEILMDEYDKNETFYISKEGDKYLLTFQPKYGSGRVYEGNEEMVDKMLNTLSSTGDLEFVVIKGATLENGKATLLDVLADKIRHLFKR